MDSLGDLKISGMGKMNGGKFNNVDISGMGKILGDIEANSITVSGSGNIGGNAKASRVSVSGNASINGDVEGERVESSGNFKTSGSVKAAEISNSGRIRIDGNLKSKKIISEGMLSIGGELEAEEFYTDGVFKVGGLLNANTIDVKIQWDSYAKEIGGETIKVRKGKHFGMNFIFLLFSKGFGLQADVIEGTDIYLENTKAKVVRGNKVKIGPDCNIDQVEYTDSFEVAAGSVVKNQVKS